MSVELNDGGGAGGVGNSNGGGEPAPARSAATIVNSSAAVSENGTNNNNTTTPSVTLLEEGTTTAPANTAITTTHTSSEEAQPVMMTLQSQQQEQQQQHASMMSPMEAAIEAPNQPSATGSLGSRLWNSSASASRFLGGFMMRGSNSSNNTNNNNDNDDSMMLSEPLISRGHDAEEAMSLDIEIDQQQQNGTSMLTKTKYSLAYSPTTRWYLRYLVSIWVIGTHILFLYGQFIPMWNLRADSDIDVWANATTAVSKQTFKTLGIDSQYHLVHNEEHEVVTFTYGFGIEQLWKAEGFPEDKSKFGPRLGAVLLVLFSGIWPHIKLFLLHLCWWIPTYEKSRTSYLYWLGALGKWSLADVFVICIMVGVVNLNWIVEPEAIKEGVVTELPVAVHVAEQMYTSAQTCSKLLKYDCDHADWKHSVQCMACKELVNRIYTHPEWSEGIGREILNGVDTSGGGECRIHVTGLLGLYCFCAGVILSLLLSCFVDILDHHARTYTSNKRKEQRRLTNEESLDYDDENQHQDSSMMYNDRTNPDPDLVAAGLVSLTPLPEHTTLLINRIPNHINICAYAILSISAGITAFMVAFAVSAPTMVRNVVGAFPQILHDVLGIDFYFEYSLSTLVGVSGAAGGWDHLLMYTFGIFVAIGPILRGVLCVIYLLVPMNEDMHQKLLMSINFVGSFCAWEVFALALVMVQMEMADVTNTIVNLQECQHISDDGSCLQVEYSMLPTSGLIWLGGCLLLLISTIAVKIGFKGLDPYHDGDSGGPYCCCCCCCCKSNNQNNYDISIQDDIMVNYQHQQHRPMLMSTMMPRSIAMMTTISQQQSHQQQQQQQQYNDEPLQEITFETDTAL